MSGAPEPARTPHPGYRPCVGVVLFNAAGLVFIGQRKSKKSRDKRMPDLDWQMPQGGIDAGEAAEEAVLRELQEETNVTSASILAESPFWYAYDLPNDLVRQPWRGRFKGQTQKWFALRFEGDESEINIDAPAGGHRPEFVAWRWERIEAVPALIIAFKRPVYERVVADFRHLAA